VIVSGPPASGKSTIALRLANDLSLPLIAKDGIKEVLFDAFGTRDREWSEWLGRCSFALIWHFLRIEVEAGRSAVIEGNFSAEYASREISALASRADFAVLQIHCHAPTDLLYDRYAQRVSARHRGHADDERLTDIREQLDPERYLLPVEGGLISLDTSSFERLDYDAIRSAVEAHLHA
jgi:predicted kinase